MSPVEPAFALLKAEIARLSADFGRPVDVDALGVLDRNDHLRLARPGLRSPNAACRLVRAADGWMAVNLAREDDRNLVPAWLKCGLDVDPWTAVATLAGARTLEDLISDAVLFGMPVAAVAEVAGGALEAPLIELGAGSTSRRRRIKVVDLSTLWAGPLCGAILAQAGANVVRVESLRRPDPTRFSTPGFFDRLNGAKSELRLDLSTPAGRARLQEEIAAADVLITSARPRGLASLGLLPERTFLDNPGLIWVAITGYGWTGPASERVAFGDDAAAAGGLVGWSADGAPRFLGDALADPLTGLAAAAGAFEGLFAGGGVLVDAALAQCAAGAAFACHLRTAA